MKLEDRILSSNKYLFTIGFTLFAIIIMVAVLYVIYLFGIELPDRKSEKVTVWYFITYLVLAPIIETFIFQKLPIDFLRNSIKRDWPLVAISTILFASIHYINELLISDVMIILMAGWVLAYAYILAKKREDLNAYLAVVLIHAGYNLFAVIIHLIGD